MSCDGLEGWEWRERQVGRTREDSSIGRGCVCMCVCMRACVCLNYDSFSLFYCRNQHIYPPIKKKKDQNQTFLVAQTVKHLPTMWETRVWSLGWEDPLEKAMAPHSSTLAWKIPWTEERGRLQSKGPQRVVHDWVTSLSLSKPQYWWAFHGSNIVDLKLLAF